MVESIYFGGGTPSILSPEQISDIIEIFKKRTFSPNIEITLEANPEDISEEFAR
jgi:oxygen-independent coproporphyrinogen-3 oxidase